MGAFLRENWVWILVPLVALAILVVLILWLGGAEESPFVYPIS